MQGGDDVLGIADIGAHIGPVIGEDAVLGGIGQHPGGKPGGRVQGVDGLFQQLVGVLFLEFRLKFLIHRLQHLRHPQGDALGVVKVLARGPPAHRPAVVPCVLDEVVEAAPQDVFIVAEQDHDVVHPGVKAAAAPLQVVDVGLQVAQGLPVLARGRWEPVLVRAHHEVIHGLVDLGIVGLGGGKTGHVQVQHLNGAPGHFQHPLLDVVDVVGEVHFAKQQAVGAPTEPGAVELIVHDFDEGTGEDHPLGGLTGRNHLGRRGAGGRGQGLGHRWGRLRQFTLGLGQFSLRLQGFALQFCGLALRGRGGQERLFALLQGPGFALGRQRLGLRGRAVAWPRGLPGEQRRQKEDDHQGHQEEAVAQQARQQGQVSRGGASRRQGHRQVLWFFRSGGHGLAHPVLCGFSLMISAVKR